MGVGLVQRRVELLQRQIKSCQSCHLHLYCQSPVPPTVPVKVRPELLIIGEAPGGSEDREGRPFIGPAGQLIFRLLKMEMGISRSQCMVANACACRPTVANKGVTNRQPSKPELVACRKNVAASIDLYVQLGGRWVLLLGSTALGAVVPDAKISNWAGRPFVLTHRRRLLDCIAVFHPAAALRDPVHIPTMKRHLNYLAALRRDVGGLWPETCCLCGGGVAVYDGMGVAWCEAHRGWRKERLWVPEVGGEQMAMRMESEDHAMRSRVRGAGEMDRLGGRWIEDVKDRQGLLA